MYYHVYLNYCYVIEDLDLYHSLFCLVLFFILPLLFGEDPKC